MLQAILTVLLQLVVLKIYGSTIENSSQTAVQRPGNETDLFEQDIAAMCEAQQEEEDEQCEVEEVSDQDFDETYRDYCDRL